MTSRSAGAIPRVAVLLPVRNAARYLDLAIDSLRRQSFSDIEMICVDDGSIDDSGALLARHAESDPRIRVISTPARGIVHALNTALEETRAPLVARMDADDASHRDRIFHQVDLLERRADIDVASCLVRAFPARSVRRGMRDYLSWSNGLVEPEDIDRDLLVECPVVHPTLLARRAALVEIGGYRDGDFPEDYDLILRLHRAGRRFAKVPCVLYAWREGEERLTRCDSRYDHGRFLDLKADHLREVLGESGRPVVMVGAGVVSKPLARRLQARGLEVSAFLEVNPRKIGQVIHGAPVIHGDEWETVAHGFFVAAVSARGQREVVRADLRERGLVEGQDFVCAV